MSTEKPWWVTSDATHPANKEAPMALDDTPTPPPAPSSDWQSWMHDRVSALEAWAKSAKYPWSDNIHGQAPAAAEEPVAPVVEEPAPVVAPPAQDPSVEGVG